MNVSGLVHILSTGWFCHRTQTGHKAAVIEKGEDIQHFNPSVASFFTLAPKPAEFRVPLLTLQKLNSIEPEPRSLYSIWQSGSKTKKEWRSHVLLWHF